MANSLDKLKALTSRLEEKLEEKKTKTQNSTSTKKEKAKTQTQHTLIDPIVPNIEKKITKAYKGKNDADVSKVRKENIQRVKRLYEKLNIYEKSPDFDNIFMYKAMNLSGIGLKEEDFGQVREGKYIQIIAITYEPDKNGKKKAKNISLGYFGKADSLDPKLKNEIIEFVLRWRYEKAFQNLRHYKELIARVELPSETLF